MLIFIKTFLPQNIKCYFLLITDFLKENYIIFSFPHKEFLKIFIFWSPFKYFHGRARRMYATVLFFM